MLQKVDDQIEADARPEEVVVDVLENNKELEQISNPVIYVRGVKSDSFYLILHGKVMICSGSEGFMIE